MNAAPSAPTEADGNRVLTCPECDREFPAGAYRYRGRMVRKVFCGQSTWARHLNRIRTEPRRRPAAPRRARRDWARQLPPPPRAPCPTPGFNGAHYYVEVDPADGSLTAFTGFLRCKWCGMAYRAYQPPRRRDAESRVLRVAGREEEFRAVHEAL